MGIDEAKVTEESSFIDDLGADSLDTVELVMAFEEEFGSEISDSDAEKILTVGDAVKFIENKSSVEILAIGIGHDVSRYYSKAIKITDVHELGDVMINQLSDLFNDKKKLH